MMAWVVIGVVLAVALLVGGCGESDPPDPKISLECRRAYAEESNAEGLKWGLTHGPTAAQFSETETFRRSLRKWCEDRGVEP